MNGFWKKVAALCIAAAAIAASVAIATAATGGDENNSSTQDKPTILKARIAGDPEEHLSALANELGVSNSELRDAFDAVLRKLGPPKPPTGSPSRSEMEHRCNELTDALGKELGKSGDEVRSAIKTVMKGEIEDAVKNGALTQSQADKMLAGLDDAACLPAIGMKVDAYCGPPPGAERGSGKTDSTLPAPPPGAPMFEFGPGA